MPWPAGPPRMCDAALRPRGRARLARAGRRWRTRGGHVAGGLAVHADACEGRHVVDGGAGSWRAHGHSGTLVREGGGNAISG